MRIILFLAIIFASLTAFAMEQDMGIGQKKRKIEFLEFNNTLTDQEIHKKFKFVSKHPREQNFESRSCSNIIEMPEHKELQQLHLNQKQKDAKKKLLEPALLRSIDQAWQDRIIKQTEIEQNISTLEKILTIQINKLNEAHSVSTGKDIRDMKNTVHQLLVEYTSNGDSLRLQQLIDKLKIFFKTKPSQLFTIYHFEDNFQKPIEIAMQRMDGFCASLLLDYLCLDGRYSRLFASLNYRGRQNYSFPFIIYAYHLLLQEEKQLQYVPLAQYQKQLNIHDREYNNDNAILNKLVQIKHLKQLIKNYIFGLEKQQLRTQDNLDCILFNHNIDIVKAALELGANPNTPSEWFKSPLIFASLTCHNRQMVDLLLGYGANPDLLNEREQKAFKTWQKGQT